jgi:hypothetical protein
MPDQITPARSRIVDVLALVVAAVFVASLTALAVLVPPGPDLALSGPAVISGAMSLLTAVAGFIVGFVKAVQVTTGRG